MDHKLWYIDVNNISGKLNFNGKTALDSIEINCKEYDEETIRIYLDCIHNIDIPEDKLGHEQLLKLIRWLLADGKTGNYLFIFTVLKDSPNNKSNK